MLAEHRDEIAKSYFDEGKSYQSIADRYEVSREAVRQFLDRNFPDRESGFEFRKRVVQKARETKKVVLTKEMVPCTICGKSVARRGKKEIRTCSTEHSQLWAKARSLLDEDQRARRRLSLARSILRYREERDASSVRWAEGVLGGAIIKPPNHQRTNSETYHAYEEVLKIRKEIDSAKGIMEG